MLLFSAIFLVLSSCGIPNIYTLTAPTAFVPSSQLQGNSITHQLLIVQPSNISTIYDSTTNFSGYNIYYRIYSQGTGATNLNNDNTLLTNYNPTVTQLVNSLGYKLLIPSTNLDSSGDPTSAGSTEPTINVAQYGLTSSQVTFTLDFSTIYSAGFLNQLTSTNLPGATITCSDSIFTPLRVYRNVFYPTNFVPSLFPSAIHTSNYSNYYKDWYSLFDKAYWVAPLALDADMYPTTDTNGNSINIASGNFGQGLEIDFFIAAYSWTPDQGAIYSRPVPLGIIYI